MGIYLTTCLFLTLGLMHPVHMSFSLPEDFDGSGSDLESSGSGSGDGSEQGEITNNVDQPNSNDLIFDSTHWSAKAKSSSILETKEVFAGIVAGGITGGALAVIMTAILIYQWHNKDFGGYILGRQAHRGEVI